MGMGVTVLPHRANCRVRVIRVSMQILTGALHRIRALDSSFVAVDIPILAPPFHSQIPFIRSRINHRSLPPYFRKTLLHSRFKHLDIGRRIASNEFLIFGE